MSRRGGSFLNKVGFTAMTGLTRSTVTRKKEVVDRGVKWSDQRETEGRDGGHFCSFVKTLLSSKGLRGEQSRINVS